MKKMSRITLRIKVRIDEMNRCTYKLAYEIHQIKKDTSIITIHLIWLKINTLKKKHQIKQRNLDQKINIKKDTSKITIHLIWMKINTLKKKHQIKQRNLD
jgi:hypothetical protein